jgi:RNA polymerase sigma-70 factor, ECF subfamily
MDKAETFTSLRPLLFSLAYQLLGHRADAEDMVQECFLRWERVDAAEVRSPKAFLTTIVTRLCLKHLQSARVQREESVGSMIPETLVEDRILDPADHVQLADSLSVALLVMLQTLSPVERAVFLLREVFDCDYSQIAAMTDKTEENCRQILRRARERVAGRQPRYEVTPQHQEQALQKFLQASANGNWDELIQLLTDDAVLVCDGSDVNEAAPRPVHGISSVVESVQARIKRWLPTGALLQTLHFQNRPVVLAYQDGKPVSATFTTFSQGRIKSLCIITCPVRLRSFLVQYASPHRQPVP